ncbi:MAG: phytanoyl-CoA dioxygenase family protein [Sphingomonas sp.]
MAAVRPRPDPQLSDFAAQGHCLVRAALPAETVEAAAGPFRAYVRDRHAGLNGFERSLGASATRTVFDLVTAPSSIRDLVCAPVLGRIAADALGVAAVRVLHFNGFYKPGGGMATPWHQDMGYIPLTCDAVVTLWLPLVPVTAEMGPLIFASGSHHDGALDLAGIDQRYPVSVNAPMQPGDLSLHSGWTAHRSEPNRSGRTREAVAISYFPDGARVRSAHGGPPMMASLLAEALAGIEPGSPARGDTVPLVYAHGGMPPFERDHGS